MSIDKINCIESDRRRNFAPIVTAAALLLIPADSHAKTNSVLERQPNADTYEFSANSFIDLKDDGTYKFVNPDYVDKTTYYEKAPAPISKKTPKNDENPNPKLLAASFLCLMGGSIAMMYLHSKGLVDKISGLTYEKADLEKSLSTANEKIEILTNENNKLTKENNRLKKRPRMIL